ncbi:MAG: hypothetical protein R2795_20595 [Saprospiraceae bacterium]
MPRELAILGTTLPYIQYSWQDTTSQFISASSSPSLRWGYYRLEVVDGSGCIGQTDFYIYGYPEPGIKITTPDFNLFCNLPPLTRLYAEDTEDTYTYQWYMNGVTIPGGNGSNLRQPPLATTM